MINHEYYKQAVHDLFRALKREPPLIASETEVKISLRCGVDVHIQQINEHIALSSSIGLPEKYTAEFLLELLQANLDIDNNPTIVVSALAQDNEIVVWGKQLLQLSLGGNFTNFFGRFSYCTDLIYRRSTHISHKNTKAMPRIHSLNQMAGEGKFN
ncbi:hypothetical protein [Pseudomonas agarici]|uniref:hypothetical protein n=1 Tax=Pseudomonas agarici TaxID=46677 RepID=UPI0012E3398D|nr:hypothetical protein [Pseudomonas agarici]NWB93175.1 hypothetical protein [Pseudomonas agarici]